MKRYESGEPPQTLPKELLAIDIISQSAMPGATGTAKGENRQALAAKTQPVL